MTGVELIAQERERQIAVEGYSAEHYDAYVDGSLALAAACYAVPVPIYTVEQCGDGEIHAVWPWEAYAEDKMDACDPLRRLVIAGALIAAEIDRVLRATRPQRKETE